MQEAADVPGEGLDRFLAGGSDIRRRDKQRQDGFWLFAVCVQGDGAVVLDEDGIALAVK